MIKYQGEINGANQKQIDELFGSFGLSTEEPCTIMLCMSIFCDSDCSF